MRAWSRRSSGRSIGPPWTSAMGTAPRKRAQARPIGQSAPLLAVGRVVGYVHTSPTFVIYYSWLPIAVRVGQEIGRPAHPGYFTSGKAR